MADAITLATQFAFGLGLFYGVQKFFSTVEEKLNEDTKVEIALWMLDVERPSRRQGWASTFLKMFDRVFGPRCLSARFFARSAVATLVALAVSNLGLLGAQILKTGFIALLLLEVASNVCFDYVSLALSRKLFGTLEKQHSAVWKVAVVVLAVIISVCMASCTFVLIVIAEVISLSENDLDFLRPLVIALAVQALRPTILASLIASAWLWLYSAAGWLIRSSLRLPIGIPLLNRRFDVEKKPLQCIGMLAGGIVAVCYWGWAVVRAVI